MQTLTQKRRAERKHECRIGKKKYFFNEWVKVTNFYLRLGNTFLSSRLPSTIPFVTEIWAPRELLLCREPNATLLLIIFQLLRGKFNISLIYLKIFIKLFQTSFLLNSYADSINDNLFINNYNYL